MSPILAGLSMIAAGTLARKRSNLGDAVIPNIVVKNDYDGYFESLVRSWVNEKARRGLSFKHHQIEITAGPYRSSAVSYRSSKGIIELDFYSALRVGFGGLSKSDVEDMINLL